MPRGNYLKMDTKLTLSASPHIRKDISTSRIMYSVIFSLFPVLFGAVYFFGMRVVFITLSACASALVTEYLAQKIMRRKITIFDGSAILTGILLAFNLPVNVPLFIPIVGSFFAILVVKQVFGGLGYNFINPALAGRAFLMASWPSIMTGKWTAPIRPVGSTISGIPLSFSNLDAVTNATPLNILKNYPQIETLIDGLNSTVCLKSLFLGNVGGCIGETSVILLLIGGIFLIIKGYIDWRIPFGYIGTVLVFSTIFYYTGITKACPIFHILSGGLFLGALFMATDYVTSPITQEGRWIFAVGCGLITIAIRLLGGYPEGVSYSILFMNCFTPLIDRTVKPRRFGQKKM